MQISVARLRKILKKVNGKTKIFFQDVNENPLNVATVRIEYVPEFAKNDDDYEVVIQFDEQVS